MNDLEARIRDVLHEDAARAPLVGAMPERVRPRVRRRQAMTVATASLAAVVVIAGAVFAVERFDRSEITPAPQPTESVTPVQHWSLEGERGATVRKPIEWEDPLDAPVAWVDVTDVKFSGGHQPYWYVYLAEEPPRARAPTDVLSYGVVMDVDLDDEADYLVGIEDLPSDPGAFRVWVTDLATGDTSEQLGPPYGYPVEFYHPDERAPRYDPSMMFTFLQGGPEGRGLDHAVRFYAWASLTSDGEVVARDVAPDTGWLSLPGAP